MYLKHLSLFGFRGVGSHLDIPLAHRTIIYGPNGSGKSSILQAIAWTIYGKLPLLSGGVFTREDALVNDFLYEAKTAITLTLSNDIAITRTREKQSSTTRGQNLVTVSFEVSNQQAAVEQLIGLDLEEFFAAAFLHQETIRDFITTTPEKRSATVDRMLGTYTLRTLVKVVDPKLPAEAIDEAREAINLIDQQISQASVIAREVIQIRERKKQHGDPAQLTQLLENIRRSLVPIAEKLRLAAPESTLASLETSLDAVRLGQLGVVSDLKSQIGRLSALKERYEHAAVTSWQPIHQRKEEYGDPADLPGLLGETQRDLFRISEELGLAIPGSTIAELEGSLAAARRAQTSIIGRFEKKIGQLGTLKERYEHAAVTSWQPIHQRKEEYGDPANLSALLEEIRKGLAPIAEELGFAVPKAAVVELEKNLTDARRSQPSTIGQLERKIGQFGTLKDRYIRLSEEIIEDAIIPPELENRRDRTKARIDALNREILTLTRQTDLRQAIERELEELRREVEVMPGLLDDMAQIQNKMNALEVTREQGTRYNQILTIGQEYLEQARPEHCPICKEKISDLQSLLELLHQEMPKDIESTRQEHKKLSETLDRMRSQAAQLEQKRRQIQEQEMALAEFPEDLKSQIRGKQEESENLSDELTGVQAEISQIEGRIKLVAEHRRRLNDVLHEIEKVLGEASGQDVIDTLDQAMQAAHERVEEIQALDFEPIAAELDRAKQLQQIEKDEARLRQRLSEVLGEVEEALQQPPGDDVIGALDQAMQAAQERAEEIQALDFQPIVTELGRAKQLDVIQKDEIRLQELQSSYETAMREKRRLNFRIQRLTDLRNALQDIAQTTKQHQETIVTDVLNSLDIHRYFQQLDPHPAYRQLQIEPELTTKGTYNYWIKAVTDDRSRGTYVQTRFSTAQANCAAIAVFLAVNEHLSKKLETIILDDPSQSMDPDHKKRLAQTLAGSPRQVIVATEDPQMFELLTDAFKTPTIHELDLWKLDGASLIK